MFFNKPNLDFEKLEAFVNGIYKLFELIFPNENYRFSVYFSVEKSMPGGCMLHNFENDEKNYEMMTAVLNVKHKISMHFKDYERKHSLKIMSVNIDL